MIAPAELRCTLLVPADTQMWFSSWWRAKWSWTYATIRTAPPWWRYTPFVLVKSYAYKYMLTDMSLWLCMNCRRFSVNKTAPSLCSWNMRLTPTWWTSVETRHCTWPPVSPPYLWCCSSWSTQPTSTHRTRWNYTFRLQIITVLTTHSGCLIHKDEVFNICSAKLHCSRIMDY